MRKLGDYLHTIILATVSALAVSLLGAADYFGFAVFGESADQQAPSQQSHGYLRFHK